MGRDLFISHQELYQVQASQKRWWDIIQNTQSLQQRLGFTPLDLEIKKLLQQTPNALEKISTRLTQKKQKQAESLETSQIVHKKILSQSNTYKIYSLIQDLRTTLKSLKRLTQKALLLLKEYSQITAQTKPGSTDSQNSTDFSKKEQSIRNKLARINQLYNYSIALADAINEKEKFEELNFLDSDQNIEEKLNIENSVKDSDNTNNNKLQLQTETLTTKLKEISKKASYGIKTCSKMARQLERHDITLSQIYETGTNSVDINDKKSLCFMIDETETPWERNQYFFIPTLTKEFNEYHQTNIAHQFIAHIQEPTHKLQMAIATISNNAKSLEEAEKQLEKEIAAVSNSDLQSLLKQKISAVFQPTNTGFFFLLKAAALRQKIRDLNEYRQFIDNSWNTAETNKMGPFAVREQKISSVLYMLLWKTIQSSFYTSDYGIPLLIKFIRFDREAKKQLSEMEKYEKEYYQLLSLAKHLGVDVKIYLSQVYGAEYAASMDLDSLLPKIFNEDVKKANDSRRHKTKLMNMPPKMSLLDICGLQSKYQETFPRTYQFLKLKAELAIETYLENSIAKFRDPRRNKVVQEIRSFIKALDENDQLDDTKKHFSLLGALAHYRDEVKNDHNSGFTLFGYQLTQDKTFLGRPLTESKLENLLGYCLSYENCTLKKDAQEAFTKSKTALAARNEGLTESSNITSSEEEAAAGTQFGSTP